MRLSEAVIVVAGAVSLASAVPLAGILGFPEVPNCAIPPFVKILATDGCSSLSDWVCHCNQAGLAGLIAPAVKQSCGSKDSYEGERLNCVICYSF